MKGKLALFLGILLIFGFMFIGCTTTTDPNATPPYPFDGTTWTKTEVYEFTFRTEKIYDLNCGNDVIMSRAYFNDTSKNSYELNADGTLRTGNSVTWGDYWGHAVGIWTLKSGNNPTKGNLTGTVWTRTATLTLQFVGKKIIVKDGDTFLTTRTGRPYTITDTILSVRFSDGAANGNYIVNNDNMLTITVIPPTDHFSNYRLEGSPWRKK
jgi:hypothetical protein